MPDDVVRRYKGRVVFGSFVPVKFDEIVALESEIGHELPSAYRTFLETVNGGTLQYSIRMPTNVGGEVIGFDDVYQLGRNKQGEYGYGTLLGEYRRRKERWWAEEVPLDQLLPIARNGCGDTLYLDLRPETSGQLLAFVHGLPAWTGLTQHHVFTVVSDDFEAYLDALFIEDDIAQITWEEVIDDHPADPWRQTVEAWLDEGLPDWRSRPWAAPE